MNKYWTISPDGSGYIPTGALFTLLQSVHLYLMMGPAASDDDRLMMIRAINEANAILKKTDNKANDK